MKGGGIIEGHTITGNVYLAIILSALGVIRRLIRQACCLNRLVGYSNGLLIAALIRVWIRNRVRLEIWFRLGFDCKTAVLDRVITGADFRWEIGAFKLPAA